MARRTCRRRVPREAKSNKSYKITLRRGGGGDGEGCRVIGGCWVSTIYLAPRSSRVGRYLSLDGEETKRVLVKGGVHGTALRGHIGRDVVLWWTKRAGGQERKGREREMRAKGSLNTLGSRQLVTRDMVQLSRLSHPLFLGFPFPPPISLFLALFFSL